MNVLERKKIEPKEDGFSVMQFNTLADKCATIDRRRGFAFVNPSCLKWNYRFPGLISEIKRHRSDIISLEEVDRYMEFKKELEKNGFDSLSHKTSLSNLSVSVFWNTKKFRLIKQEKLNFKGTVCLFEFIPLKKMIVFGFVHLIAKVGNEKKRLEQVEKLNILLKKNSENGKYPVIVAGDFNDIQKSPMYEFMVKKCGFESAYGTYNEPYSTYKKREYEDICRTIDYIFYSPNIVKVNNVLEIPNKEVFKERLPAMNYPSDHLMIKATFSFE